MHGKGKIFKKKHEWRMINDKQKKNDLPFYVVKIFFSTFFVVFLLF